MQWEGMVNYNEDELRQIKEINRLYLENVVDTDLYRIVICSIESAAILRGE